jgi:Tfp pilus assembly protein PilN
MIKKDINLVPVRKKLPASITVGIPIGVFFLVFLLVIGVFLPTRILRNKEKALDALKVELEGYADTEATFQQRLKELSTLQENKKNYEDFIASGRETLDMANALDAATPDAIRIMQYTYSVDKIILSGFTQDDLQIADYEDILWKTKMFKDIDLGTISGEEGERLFVFTLTHIEAEDGGEDK